MPNKKSVSSYVLILTIITSFGGVTTQRQTGFDSYQACAEHAVAWAETQQALQQPDARVIWQCASGDYDNAVICALMVAMFGSPVCAVATRRFRFRISSVICS
jgi:hypothetical protein